MVAPLPSFAVAVPAAGAGRRMGGRKKQYLELGGQPVLLRALMPFLEDPGALAVAVAIPEEDLADPPNWLSALGPTVVLVPGGATRRDSVATALEALPEEADVLVVHDGARPLVTRRTVEACIRAAATGVGAVAGWPAWDTMKEVDAEERVVRTPERSSLWHAQTPQAFPRELLLRAYREAGGRGGQPTDDAQLVEQVGGKVRMIRASPDNLKVTRPADIDLAEALLRRQDQG